MRLIADLETDGFLEDFTTIHCIAILNADDPADAKVYEPHEIGQAIEKLQSASELVFHNGIAFDVPCIQKLYPFFSLDDIKLTDTLVLSRLIQSDLKNEDAAKRWSDTTFPKKLYGSHSLEAWGHRLDRLKGEFGKTTDWTVYTPEMGAYCLQDVRLTHKLWLHLQSEQWSEEAIRFEHELAEICHRIGRAGWTFDMNKAAALYAQLSLARSALEDELQTLFPAWTIEDEFIPKVNNSKLGYEKGVPTVKRREVQFNPNSRKHIEFCLKQKYGWKPKLFTPSGDAKVDETTLAGLQYPEAQKLAKSFMLQKRLGMLAEGNAAWMKLVDRDGKLRHTINPLGTISGRASSFGPNLQQVPAVRAAYGKECRDLFTVPHGYKLVGADLSGIELRCLAHFLPDGGEYGRQILEGDVHQVNADNLGISRPEAKTFQYALIFGAGDKRLGEILGAGPKEGRALKEKFLRATPAFAALLRQIKYAVDKRGYLLGLDGRHLQIRSEHGALNVLLQSAAALIAKQWVLLIDREIRKQNLDATIIAWVHDEVQLQVKGDADHVGNNILRRCAGEAGKHFGFNIPVDAEYTVGARWSDTH